MRCGWPPPIRRSTTIFRSPIVREIMASDRAIFLLMLIALAFLLRQRRRENPIMELERALKTGEFIPYHQPIVDITNGKLQGAEVLMRWKKKDGTIVPPAAFIPLAESSGLIVDMTRRMMRMVIGRNGRGLCKPPQGEDRLQRDSATFRARNHRARLTYDFRAFADPLFADHS